MAPYDSFSVTGSYGLPMIAQQEAKETKEEAMMTKPKA